METLFDVSEHEKDMISFTKIMYKNGLETETIVDYLISLNKLKENEAYSQVSSLRQVFETFEYEEDKRVAYPPINVDETKVDPCFGRNEPILNLKFGRISIKLNPISGKFFNTYRADDITMDSPTSYARISFRDGKKKLKTLDERLIHISSDEKIPLFDLGKYTTFEVYDNSDKTELNR